VEAVAEAIQPRRAAAFHPGGQRAQGRLRIVWRQELAQPREPACFFEMQVGDEQRLLRRPVERAIGRRVKRFACERKGNHDSVIARSAATKQSRICDRRLDCFATLAMTS
jgi:hypothetical protein